MSGGHLFEALLLKLMIERKRNQNVILEADLNLSNDHQAEGFRLNIYRICIAQ
jgi:hypothetical protein